MPCYEMNLISVEFKAANRDLLLKALKNLNLEYREYGQVIAVQASRFDSFMEIDLEMERIKANNNQFETVNQIKRQYSREVISEVVKKKRWIMKQMNQNKIQLKKY